jgi:hypothetical protein
MRSEPVLLEALVLGQLDAAPRARGRAVMLTEVRVAAGVRA